MSKSLKNSIKWLIICLGAIVIAASFARLIETDFGKVNVSNVSISDPDGVTIVARLYKPVSASIAKKAPAVINTHGYQNDKLVNDSFAIELSRRGYVVLSPDVIGHGDSGSGVSVGGVLGDPKYTGGVQSVYEFAKNLPYVDAANIGAMGHSMGAIITERLGANNPEIKAINIQCGFPGNPTLRNVLLTQARYDEFSFFRDGLFIVDSLPATKNRMDAFGLSAPVAWDTTYGTFADGTARRAALIQMEHHFLPLTNKAVAEGVSWMNQALKGGDLTLAPTSQVFMWKELLGLLTLIAALIMLIPLTNILLAFAFFAPVAQSMPDRYVASSGAWWKFATINTVIAGVTYPIMTQFGALSDKVQGILPWFKLQVANGVFLWFIVNIVIGGISFALWYRKAHKTPSPHAYSS